MKICFVCNEYPPLSGGGIGVFVKTLAESLVEMGVDVWVIGYGKKGSRPIVLKGVKVFWIHLPNILSKSISLGGYKYSLAKIIRRHFLSWHLSHLVRKEKFDIVESHDFNGPLALKPPCLLIVRLHGSVIVYRYGEGRPNQIDPLDKHFEVKQINMADNVIAVSSHIGQVTKKVISSKINPEVIYNGVDTSVFSPEPMKKNEKSLLFVGNAMWRKGVLDLIHAMPFIIEKHPDADLLIAGGASGDHRTRLIEEMESLEPNVRERIRLLGKVQQEDLPAYYQLASAFVFPSRVEAFGLTCIEAMACGCPVVATRLASGPELIEDGISGLLADPTNPLDLAEKITRILDDPALAERLGNNARQRVLEKFDLNNIGRKNLDFYQSLIKQNA